MSSVMLDDDKKVLRKILENKKNMDEKMSKLQT